MKVTFHVRGYYAIPGVPLKKSQLFTVTDPGYEFASQAEADRQAFRLANSPLVLTCAATLTEHEPQPHDLVRVNYGYLLPTSPDKTVWSSPADVGDSTFQLTPAGQLVYGVYQLALDEELRKEKL